MLNFAYTNYGGYFWMIGIAVLTYLIMAVVKKSFTPFTKILAPNNKDRRFANATLGIIFSVAIAFGLGKIGNMLFATDVYFMWFVGGGLLANYANLIVRKFTDADSSAFAKAFINAMNESNFDISEADLPILTEQIDTIVKAYAENNANSHKNKIRGVASGITGSVEITDDEARELEKHINAIKSSGKFEQSAIANLDSAYAKAKADGKITVAEKANLEAVIRAIHNATNI
jgi:tellurite resistance protein